MRISKALLYTVCIVAFLVLATYRLNTILPPRFDEGWSLSLARNVLELGHYGHLLLGNRIPATILNTGWPAVMPMVLSFRAFGIGIWQARLPFVLFGLGAIICLFRLITQLYGERTAIGATVLLTCLGIPPDMNHLFMSRQVLGEAPMLFFLLLGYLILLAAWHKSLWCVTLAGLAWALALHTKPQPFPFLMLSLAGPAVWCWLKGNRRAGVRLALVLATTLVLMQMMVWARDALIGASAPVAQAGNDPYSMVRSLEVLMTYVVVFDTPARVRALTVMLVAGLPVAAGLAYAASRFATETPKTWQARDIVRVSLWALSASWWAWFTFLSIGWSRYFFPALYLGSGFAAHWLGVLSEGFRPAAVVRQAARGLRGSPPRARNLICLIAVLTLPVMLALSVQSAFLALRDYGSRGGLAEAVAFLNSETESDAIIETYDSELFFALERAYHFPPDEVLHQLSWRSFLGREVLITYDPLVADPDYLVVGPASRMHGLYTPQLIEENFIPVFSSPGYEIFRRVR